MINICVNDVGRIWKGIEKFKASFCCEYGTCMKYARVIKYSLCRNVISGVFWGISVSVKRMFCLCDVDIKNGGIRWFLFDILGSG